MFLQTVYTEGLAHLSYLIGDQSAGVAAVIDPRRDVEIYLDGARERGVRITHVLETHIHADFVSGSRELAARTGAEVCLSGEGGAECGFPHRPLRDGEVIELGRVRLRALHTPGHTPEHLSFLASGGTGADAPWGVFTGDCLFAGEVGRPDLLGKDSAEPLARRLHRTLHEVLLPLGDHVQILPAHGKGSPCGATIGDRSTSTLGYERAHNPRLRHRSADVFVEDVLASAPEAPGYYGRMKRINAEGPEVGTGGAAVQPLDAEAFAREMEVEGTRIVDTREIEGWGGAHIGGSQNIPLREAFPVWAGWLLRPDERILLVADRPEDADTVRRHLLRIGIEGPVAYLAKGFRSWSEAALPFRRTGQMSVHELRERIMEDAGRLQVLDVRSDEEWEAGRVPGALHIHLPHLDGEREVLDPGRPVAVYCGSGYRASMGAALLERAGFEDVWNVPGSMGAWKAAGYEVEASDGG